MHKYRTMIAHTFWALSMIIFIKLLFINNNKITVLINHNEFEDTIPGVANKLIAIIF